MKIPERDKMITIPEGQTPTRNHFEGALAEIVAGTSTRIELASVEAGVIYTPESHRQHAVMSAFVTVQTDRRSHDLLMTQAMHNIRPDVVVNDSRIWVLPLREQPDIVFGIEVNGTGRNYFLARV